MFYDDLLLEVDFYASSQITDAARALCSVVADVEIDQAQSTFPNAVGDAAFSALSIALEQKGVGFKNIIKLSCYAPIADVGFWEALAKYRARCFGSSLPVISDVVSEPRPEGLRLQIDATCIGRHDTPPSIEPIGKQLQRGHPQAVLVGPLFVTSALSSPSSREDAQFTVGEEVETIMEQHTALLAAAEMSLTDVIKANTFYEGSASARALHENMSARNAYYRVPGPASTGLPVAAFPYMGKRTSIELIAARS